MWSKGFPRRDGRARIRRPHSTETNGRAEPSYPAALSRIHKVAAPEICISWRGTLQQYVGRLHRACAGKHEVRVYDYVDRQVPALMRMFAKRLKGYRAMGYVTEDRFELGMKPRQET